MSFIDKFEKFLASVVSETLVVTFFLCLTFRLALILLALLELFLLALILLALLVLPFRNGGWPGMEVVSLKDLGRVGGVASNGRGPVIMEIMLLVKLVETD